ncbi:M56 family metallopeptidase [Streptomyces sp. NPDC088197]|uniref:M56 family metallopeptidase n=1 Tax=unclassified Streptomyces TaxID=2593676 RepID=UPI0033AED0DF
MTVPFVLLILGALAAAMAPRLLSRAKWPEREPVLALWVWQCVVAAVLLCCVLAMALSASAAWAAVRGNLFAFAPSGVVDAYALSEYGRWAGTIAVLLALGGVWTAAMLTREVRGTRSRRKQRRAELRVRAPRLPGETVTPGERLVVLEDARSDAWWLSGAEPQLVITTAALRRLKGRQLDAVLAHEQGHVRARHDVLLHCSGALAGGFPQVPVFAAFRDQVHHLVELAADDTASRRFGRLTTALALVELNAERGVFGPCPTPLAALPGRVHRLLDPAPRLPLGQRVRMTAFALLVPAVPLLIAFGPGLGALT